VPERGGSCPHGFTHSGGFCVPSAGDVAARKLVEIASTIEPVQDGRI
jgi:hypothetical protein